MYGIMMGVLAPLAKFLVSQPIGPNGRRAAPCFGYYEFDKAKSELKQVQDEMQAAINAYIAVTEETPDQVAVHDFGGMLETLLPIQTTINGLVDLKSFEEAEEEPAKEAEEEPAKEAEEELAKEAEEEPAKEAEEEPAKEAEEEPAKKAEVKTETKSAKEAKAKQTKSTAEPPPATKSAKRAQKVEVEAVTARAE